MEVQRFEQAILKLAFETEARITTASVAYYLGIPSREANRLLNLLLEEGVLELDSDSEGNLFYLVPHQGEHKQAFSKESFQRISAPAQPGLMLSPPSAAVQQNLSAPPINNSPVSPDFSRPALHPQPALQNHPLTEPPITFVHPNSPGDNSAAYSPQTQPPTINHATGFDRGHRAPERNTRYPSFGQDGDNTYGPPLRNPEWIQSQQAEPRHLRSQTAVRENLFFDVTSRNPAPDASLNRCGSSSVILNTTTRCEPQPLPEATPTVVSCSGYEHYTVTTRDDYRFGFAGTSTALAAIPNNDYILDNAIEQPEHQPGMALLLSLILCGTGQIYNGEVSKGIIMMVLCFLLWFVLLGWVVHIWSIVDAVVVAERINRKHN